MARRSIVTALIVATLCVGGQSVVVAHEERCLTTVLEVPLEKVAAPTGWKWATLAYGGALGLPGWVGGLDLDSTDDYGYMSVALTCAPAAALALARQEEVQLALGATKLDVVQIGDGAVALRGADGDTSILWYNGDVSGLMSTSSEEVDFGAMEEFALAIDALVP